MGKVGEHVKAAFETMRFIVTVGWSIYPLGYFFGYLQGQVSDEALNLIYNLADMVNKIAFCLSIWHSAKKDTSERAQPNRCSDELLFSHFLPVLAAFTSHTSAHRQHLGIFWLAEQQCPLKLSFSLATIQCPLK